MPKYFGLDDQRTELGLGRIGQFLTMVLKFKNYSTINIASSKSFGGGNLISAADLAVERG